MMENEVSLLLRVFADRLALLSVSTLPENGRSLTATDQASIHASLAVHFACTVFNQCLIRFVSPAQDVGVPSTRDKGSLTGPCSSQISVFTSSKRGAQL